MKIEPYKGKSAGGNVKYFSATGPKGTLLIGVTYTNRKTKNGMKLEYQVREINPGGGWTKECPDTRAILLNTTGETFKGLRDRLKWLESVYKGTPGPEMITASNPTHKPSLAPSNPAPSIPVLKGVPKVQEGSYEVTIHGPTDTDILTVTKRRGEQHLLRDFLMKGSDCLPCAICGRLFTPEHLITAHIKKRSKASEDERRDPSIVVPMCVMGCDALFEYGWIGVKNGKVLRLNPNKTTTAVEEIISGLVGKTVTYWNSKSKPYFEWHLQHHNEKFGLQRSF